MWLTPFIYMTNLCGLKAQKRLAHGNAMGLKGSKAGALKGQKR